MAMHTCHRAAALHGMLMQQQPGTSGQPRMQSNTEPLQAATVQSPWLTTCQPSQQAAKSNLPQHTLHSMPSQTAVKRRSNLRCLLDACHASASNSPPHSHPTQSRAALNRSSLNTSAATLALATRTHTHTHMYTPPPLKQRQPVQSAALLELTQHALASQQVQQQPAAAPLLQPP